MGHMQSSYDLSEGEGILTTGSRLRALRSTSSMQQKHSIGVVRLLGEDCGIGDFLGKQNVLERSGSGGDGVKVEVEAAKSKKKTERT